MNKKILYISYDGMTDPLGQSQVLPYLIGLARKGYQFTLLSFEKKDRFQKSGALIQTICDNNNIRWEHEFFSSRPPVLSKMYDSWRMKKKVMQLHRECNFDFTHCRSYVAAAAGLYLQKKAAVPFLFDMRGFWVDERVDNGQWNLGNPLYKIAYSIYKKKEKKYFQQAAHVVSLTQNGKEELVANYNVSENKISVIPCCADLQHFDYNRISEAEKTEVRNKLGLKSTDQVLSYLGSLGGWYLTEEMLDFFLLLKQQVPGTKFLFITHDKRESITSLAGTKGINANDIIVQPATRQQVPQLLAVSSWSIFFIKDAYSKKASSPTKQGEIMAMGIPVICNDIGDTGKIVEASGAGLVLKKFDRESYSQAVAQTDTLSDLDREAIRRSAFDYYDLNKGVEIYEKIYKEVAK